MDNITVSQLGDIYVAEDGGDLQIVVIDKQGGLYPVVQLEGHDGSEMTGVAFSPDGKRLFLVRSAALQGCLKMVLAMKFRDFEMLPL